MIYIVFYKVDGNKGWERTRLLGGTDGLFRHTTKYQAARTAKQNESKGAAFKGFKNMTEASDWLRSENNPTQGA